MGFKNLPRRNFLSLLGVGGAFVAGAAVAPHLVEAGGDDARGGSGPLPKTEPASGEREVMESQVIKDQPGIRLVDKMIVGGSGLKLIRCPGAVIENLDISRSDFSGLWLVDCPDSRVLGGNFHHNGRDKNGSPSGRIGHGILLSGNSNGILIHGAEAFDNFEDGSQLSRDCTGRVTYKGVHFHHNQENGLDAKGGFVRLETPNMHSNGDGRGMEPVILHRNCTGLECFDGSLIVRKGEDNADCIRTANGAPIHVERTTLNSSGGNSQPISGSGNITLIEAKLITENRPLIKVKTPCNVLLDRCGLFKPGTNNWYQVDDIKYDMALDLDAPNLRVKNGNTT